MVVVENKKIAEAEIEREVAVTPKPVTPTPTPVPTKEMEQFIIEHEKLKGIIERHKPGCVTLATLMTEGGVTEVRLNQHVDLFVGDDYVAKIVKDAICSRDAIKELKKRMESD